MAKSESKKPKKAMTAAEKAEEKQLKKEARAEIKSQKKSTPKDTESIKKNVITGLVVLLAVAALGTAIYLKTKPAKVTPENEFQVEEEDIAIKDAKLKDIVLHRTVTEIPLIATDFPTIFYTADAVGNVNFFEWNGTEQAKIQPTGTMDFSLTLSGQNIHVNIPYVERDGVLNGYGLYTADQNQENVYIYNFIMFKICNLPSAYAKEGKCLLLMHTDNTKAYFQHPTWEQAFILDRNTGATEDFLNDRSQMLGQDGGIRRTQYIINESTLAQSTTRLLFASSRGYEADAEGNYPIDIYEKKGRDDVLLLKGVMDDYIKPLENGNFAFLRKTDTGISSILCENGEEKTIKTFESKEYSDAYRRSGDYILDTETGTISTMYSNHSFNTKGYRMNPQEFAVGPNEKYVAMVGTSANVFDYYIYIYNNETKKFASFKDENYAPHYNLHFMDDHTVSYYAVSMDGFENVVIDLSRVK